MSISAILVRQAFRRRITTVRFNVLLWIVQGLLAL